MWPLWFILYRSTITIKCIQKMFSCTEFSLHNTETSQSQNLYSAKKRTPTKKNPFIKAKGPWRYFTPLFSNRSRFKNHGVKLSANWWLTQPEGDYNIQSNRGKTSFPFEVFLQRSPLASPSRRPAVWLSSCRRRRRWCSCWRWTTGDT